MREGWVETTLGEIAEVIGGGTPRTSVRQYWNGAIPWITPTEVVAQDGRVVTRTERAITEEGLRNSGARRLPAGAVLLTSRATIGAVALAGVPMATNQGFASLLCGPSVLPSYLMLWCQANRDEFIARGAGATFKEVSKTNVRSMPIALPPLGEQRRVVDLLSAPDRAMQCATVYQSAIENLLASVFSEVFEARAGGVSARRLGDVAEIVMGQSPPGPLCNREGVGIALLNGPTEFGRVSPSPAQWTTSPRKQCVAGDVLICVRGATAGLMNRAGQVFALGRGVGAVRGTDANHTEFTYAAIRAGLARLLAGAAGTIFPNIARSDLEALRIWWPSTEERELVARAVAAADEAGLTSQVLFERLARLRSSILTGLLSGEHEIPQSYDALLEEAAVA